MAHSQVCWKNLIVKIMAALCLLASTPLYAVDLSIVGSATYGRPYANDNISNAYSQQVGYGGGLLAEFELNPYFSFETGALYLDRAYGTQNGGPIVNLPYVQLPAELKLWVFPWMAIGGGAYYSFGAGDSTGWPSQSFSNYGLKDRDYGILGSLSIAVPVSPWVSFYTELQYINSVDNAVSPPNDQQQSLFFRDAQALVGIRFREVGEASQYSREYTITSKRRYY